MDVCDYREISIMRIQGVNNPIPCSMCGTMDGGRCTANEHITPKGITFCRSRWEKFSSVSAQAKLYADQHRAYEWKMEKDRQQVDFLMIAVPLGLLLLLVAIGTLFSALGRG